jgi:transitional endoplasmic reticulum ATPase
LHTLHKQLGGVLLTMKDFVDAMRSQHPLAMEETFERLLMHAFHDNDTVMVDDFHLFYNVVCGCGPFDLYPRSKFAHAPLMALATYVAATGKKLFLSSQGAVDPAIEGRCFRSGIEKFTPEDYAFLCGKYLTPACAEQLDYAKIHRFAPKLNAHQLKGACLWLAKQGVPNTERFIDYLRSQKMASNVQLDEVQAVELSSLKGIDDILRSLEANIILPMENDELAAELGIKPKRGVLLAGPPGTGKTTIGRALAHRLKSKFFLIDGTFISGTQQFYQRVSRLFEDAKQNAPSILFIDDSDVIFENNDETGLYRYLLTMLDGLESESAGRVCVMMTAMNVSSLPPALIRSGRIELWLETRLPDEEARLSILHDHAANLPTVLQSLNVPELAAATDGMTGADLKRLVEDGKILYAYDRAQQAELRPVTEYFLRAVETVRTNKERYTYAEAQARIQRPQRPPWFGMAAMSMMESGEDED